MRFSRRILVANEDIKTFKVLYSKNPDLYRSTQGAYRSFDTPDRFKEYEIGNTYSSILELGVRFEYYNYDIGGMDVDYRTTGITALSHPVPVGTRSRFPRFDTILCECIIPKGAHYYIDDDNEHYLTDRLTIVSKHR